MTPLDEARARNTLATLESRLRHAGAIARNADNTEAGEVRAIALDREANAVAWAVRELAPKTEAAE